MMIKILLISSLVAVASSSFEFVPRINDNLRGIVKPFRLGHLRNDIQPSSKARNAIIGKSKRWPNGVIPYTFTTTYPENQKQTIFGAMKAIQNNTCITYVPKKAETDWITFAAHPSGDACSSNVGRAGIGEQVVYLSHSNKGTCLTHAIVLHELMHAIGLDHEHNRADRDNFVYVDENKVEAAMVHNFVKSTAFDFFDYGCPYNYESVMHYDKTSFGKIANSVTMEPKNRKYADIIGNVPDAHPTDYEKINRVYGCNKKVTGHTCGVRPPTPCIDDPPQKDVCEKIGKGGGCLKVPNAVEMCRKSCNGCI